MVSKHFHELNSLAYLNLHGKCEAAVWRSLPFQGPVYKQPWDGLRIHREGNKLLSGGFRQGAHIM